VFIYKSIITDFILTVYQA